MFTEILVRTLLGGIKLVITLCRRAETFQFPIPTYSKIGRFPSAILEVDVLLARAQGSNPSCWGTFYQMSANRIPTYVILLGNKGQKVRP